MNILVATGLYPPEIGGPATYTVMLETHLPKHGFVVSVLPFSAVRWLPKVLRHFAYFVLCLWNGFKTDIIFAQDPLSVGLPAICAAKILGKKFIIRMPGDYAWEQATQRFGVSDTIDEFQHKAYTARVERLRTLQSFVARHAQRVVTPSHYFQDIVIGWGVPKEKVVVIYNGIELSVESVKPKKIPSGNIIVSAGRLVPWKGFKGLIDVLAELPPNWVLVIVGEGPEHELLIKYAAVHSVSERVVFAGRLSREEVFGWYKVATVFALNTSFESFSFQIVEAMASGVPVVTTHIGSIPELITDGVEGVLLEPDDRDGFCTTIESINADTDVWNKRTKKAQEKAKQFSIETTVTELSNLLTSL